MTTTIDDDTSCKCSEGTPSCPYRYVKIDNKYYLRDTTYYDVNNKYCHDCGILNAKGNTHHPGCDMEICPACGGQLAFDDNMHDEILVSNELPEGAKLTAAKYDAEFRKKQEEIRKWQIQATVVGEPHTVSFIRQQDYFAAIESPYLIANSTQLTPANPNEKNTQPFIIPGQNDTTTTNTIVVANKRATLPAVIDAQNNVTYLPLNGNYTMSGDELYVNSGWIWPQGQTPPGLPPITSFSVTFENAGTYDYICVIHPWMAGQVIVQ